MSLQELILKGTLVSTGAPQILNINAGFDEFVLRNRTTLAAGAGVTEARWNTTMANGCASIETLGAGTFVNTYITAGGFSYRDTTLAPLGAAVTNITAISQANPIVFTTATTPTVGQVVRVYATTGMLQIAGMDLQVTAVNAGVSFTSAYLSSAGWAFAGTAGTYRVVNYDLPFYPRKRYITGITAAAQAVVSLSVAHGYAIGDKVYFGVTPAFGMSEMNGLTGTVVAVPAVNQITVDIDSSTFTAFAFPTSAVAAGGITFPSIVPAGEVSTKLTGAIKDEGNRGIYIGATIQGTAGDVFEYWAVRSAT